MNQPRGHCITGRLLTNTRSFLFPDLSADSDVGGGEDDDDWQYIGPEFDGSGFEEAPNFTGETQIGDPDPFIECYPGASANYGRGHTFMDTFNADRFSSERQNNLFYPFSSKAEWEFASWLASSGLSMAAINKCLSLDIVCSSPNLHQVLTPYSRSNHLCSLFGQRERSASLLSCCRLGLSGSVGPLNPNRLQNTISNYSIGMLLNAFSTFYTRRLSGDR